MILAIIYTWIEWLRRKKSAKAKEEKLKATIASSDKASILTYVDPDKYKQQEKVRFRSQACLLYTSPSPRD